MVLTNTCLAVLPALILTEMVDYCSVLLLSKKIDDVVMIVFHLVVPLIKQKKILQCCIFYLESQPKMSKLSGGFAPRIPHKFL